MINFRSIADPAFLTEIASQTKYESLYLYFSLLILLCVISFRISLFIKGQRPEAYRGFDKLWFWGLGSMSLFGFFVYFSRTQALPFFSSRMVSYTWIVLVLGYIIFLIFYFRKKIPQKLEAFFESKRKEKYLKSKS